MIYFKRRNISFLQSNQWFVSRIMLVCTWFGAHSFYIDCIARTLDYNKKWYNSLTITSLCVILTKLKEGLCRSQRN